MGRARAEQHCYDNKDTGVKITFFPVIHARKGSVGYKLEWTRRLSDKPCP